MLLLTLHDLQRYSRCVDNDVARAQAAVSKQTSE